VPTAALTAAELEDIRGLLDDAFGTGDDAFTDEDWDHSVGGVHFVLDVDGPIVAHASVVPRTLHVAGMPLRAGYVEAVATAAERQGRGFGSRLMQDVTAYIRERFVLGALGTGRLAFYERLGWAVWRGPSSVRVDGGERRTPDEDGYIMVLRTALSADLDLDAPISCEWRPGDVW
jgi:aminoglycoside 2'-N-acetyltransferase I